MIAEAKEKREIMRYMKPLEVETVNYETSR